MTAPADARRLGEIVGGKYRLTRFLAGGGMGVVYEAQHAVVRRRFAIKFLRRDFSERREILMRFQREAEAAGALESENVTAAVDFGVTDDGSPYIVMEFLVGESLEALLARSRRLPVERAADLVLQACRGIAAAHVAGIIHRDLKPHNLFLCRRQDGTDLVKVLDFGIAKLEAFDDGLATRTGLVLGTPAYMSPEQARGDRDLDARADVYGLAAILYQLLSGDKPHPGASHNAILHHIATQPAVPLRADALALPAALVAIVERGLAADVGARFASADALAEALGPFARREVWPAPEPPAATPVAETPAPAGASRGASALASAAPAPRRIVAAAAVAALVLVVGAAVAAIVSRSTRHVARAEAPVAPAAAAAPAPAIAPAPVAPPVAPAERIATTTLAPSPTPAHPRPAAAPIGHGGAGGRPRGRPSGRPEPPEGGSGTAPKPAGPADKAGPPPRDVRPAEPLQLTAAAPSVRALHRPRPLLPRRLVMVRRRSEIRVGLALWLGVTLALSCTAHTPAPVAVVPATSPHAPETVNPFAGVRQYVNPDYARTVEGVAARTPAQAPGLRKLATLPTAVWLDSIDKTREIPRYLDDARAQAGAAPVVPVFVVYDLPSRDCAAEASNGELGPDAAGEARYQRDYVDAIAAAFKAHAGQRIVVVLEPDSLANIATNLGVERCAAAEPVYRRAIAYAIATLSLPNVFIYLDAAHAGWLGWPKNLAKIVQVYKEVLTAAGGADRIRGFALNVSNYDVVTDPTNQRANPDEPSPDELTYARDLSDGLAGVGITGKGFLIDTGRNGKPGIRTAPGNWCNVKGAGLGERPRAAPAPLIDAYVWIKVPGESDGTADTKAARFDPNCASDDATPGAPEAGKLFEPYLVDLVKNANPPL